MMEKVNDGLYYDERSAGGIVYRPENGKVVWLVVKTAPRKYKRGGGGLVYKFPKGHLAKDEVLKQAALREVEEEGRIKCKVVTKIGSNDYIIWDKLQKRKIIKKVTFFLMEYVEQSNLKYYDSEMVVDREWLSFEEAMNRLAFDSEKVLLRKAKIRLEAMTKTRKN